MTKSDGDDLHVLHVDDSPVFLETTEMLLAREDERFEVTTAPSVTAGLEHLESSTVHCVVSDHDMPGRDGLDFLRAVREHHPTLPFVLFTGKGSEEIASEAISAGVTEYIQKGGPEQYPLLANRIKNAVTRHRTERQNVRLRAFTEQSSDLVTLLDEAGVIRYQSPSARDILGYAPEDLLGSSAFEYVHPDDRELVLDAFNRGIEDPTVQPTVTYRFRDADGDWRVMESRGTNRLDDPVVEGVVINSRDVTERERLASEYERTVERMTDGFVSVDRDWRFSYLNEAGREVFCAAAGEDRPIEELLETNMWEFVPEAVGTVFYRKYTEAMETQTPVTFEAEYPPLDAWFSVRVYPSESGLSIYFQDVTERHERERAVEAQRMRFDTLFENIPEAGLYAEVVDGEPIIRSINPAFTEVFGYDPAEAVGERVNDLIVPEGDLEQARSLDREAVDGAVVTEEVERITATGERRAFRYYGVPMPDTVGDVTEGFAIYTDITDQQRREAALERQNERLENVVSFVSHDLRNPLGIAQGNVDLAREDEDCGRLDLVEDALDRMDTLIEGLLRLARESTEVDQFEPHRLSDLAARAWRTVETGEATYVVESDAVVLADGPRLQRAFENLFRNSVEHSSTGSRPSGESPEAEPTSTDGGSDVVVRLGSLTDGTGFYVADNGPGIPEDARETVFESGYTTRSEGTGFGLAIVREVVQAHDWAVRVVAAEGGGTRFEVTGVEFA